MFTKIIGRMTYSNVMATLAFFIAVGSGTAFAVVSANQVNSASIINRQVKKPDLAGSAVTKSKLHANAVSSTKVLDNSLKGADVGNGSLTKADVSSGQFGSAPAAATFASHDPVDFTFSNATQVIYTGDNTNGTSGGTLIHLSTPGYVLATASLRFYNTSATSDFANCYFSIAPDGNPSPTAYGQAASDDFGAGQTLQLPMAAGISKSAGDYYVNVKCSSLNGTIAFDKGDLIVWALPQQ